MASYVCVNLKKVNAATIRDNYPLLIAEHVIERVADKEAYSFLDGFSGYNQVSIDPKDQYKMAFATEWGIFAYKAMPFGLTNEPATFQRLMSHVFKEYRAGISLRYIWMIFAYIREKGMSTLITYALSLRSAGFTESA